MTQRVCLVHYHEIGLKGKNRSTFENQLVRNLNRALRGQGVDAVKRVSGHILVSFASGQATEDHARIIAQVPGVARVSLAYLCHLDETEYCAAAVKALGEAGDFETFKVHARRSATAYGLHTLDIHQLVGGVLCEAFPTKKVQMRNPDVTVFVLVARVLYMRIVTSLSSSGGRAEAYSGDQAQQQTPVFKALVQTEFRKVVRNSSVLLNYVVMFDKQEKLITHDTKAGSVLYTPVFDTGNRLTASLKQYVSEHKDEWQEALTK